ncbi:MAG TPA: trigger factor [Ktedonobacterales bacterium]
MNVTIERPSESEAVLHVELDWAELEKASDRAYRKLVQKYKVPGFRPGHAPRSMIERMVGKETLYQEGLEDLVDSAYRDAVREHKLTPLAQPEVEAPEFTMGEPYTFTARVPVLAPVKLGDYHATSVPYPSTAVGDEDVERMVERTREQQAMWLPVERPAQIGDQLTMDLHLTAGDRQISDLHDTEFQLVEDRPGIYAGMDEQLVGLREGESKQFTTTIPEGYANAELAGKEAQYDVTVKAVKERELPELDDELAKAAGEFETLEGMRASYREQLERQRETEARREFRDAVLKEVTDQAQAEVHPVVVNDEVEHMLDELRNMLGQSRLDLETFLQMSGKTEEQYREELRPEAEGRAKREMVLDAVAEAEQIPVGDNEIEQWLNFVTALGGKRRRLRDLSAGQRSSISHRLAREKATDLLLDLAQQNAAGEAGATAAAAEGEAIAAEAAPATAEGSGAEAPAQPGAAAESAQTQPAAKAEAAPAKPATKAAKTEPKPAQPARPATPAETTAPAATTQAKSEPAPASTQAAEASAETAAESKPADSESAKPRRAKAAATSEAAEAAQPKAGAEPAAAAEEPAQPVE